MGCLQSIVDATLGDSEVIVVPKCERTSILKVAHDRLGHSGYRKVLLIICRNFCLAEISCRCEGLL